MRIQSLALSSFACVALAAPAMAGSDKMPKLDVAQSCREAQAIAGEDKDLTYKGCMHDEKNAEVQLVQRWSKFKAADRQNCLAQGGAPLPSYVEILTCLEMYDEASTLYRAGTSSDRNSVGVTLPSALPAEAPLPLPVGRVPEAVGGIMKPE